MCPEPIDLTAVAREEALIESLQREAAYPHLVENLQVLDTHISWVVLTGPFAYKIKKPIKLEFLDFSSLEQRKHFCEEELRLNRRWLPELYLDVVPICGSFEKPVVSGSGPAIEYAVKMVQFPYSARLDQQLEAGLLVETDMLQLAEAIAERHGTLPKCTDLGEEEMHRLVRHPMLENIEHLRQGISDEETEILSTWTRSQLQLLWTTVMQRETEGFVRECHGDLHLANLVRLKSGLAAFDCVEFNADLRNIDVISDVSFLVMDLISRERQDLAFLFINRYLECTGDYAGMSVFGLYYVYHALIRAKIAAIRSTEQTHEADRQADLDEMAHYCKVARQWIDSDRACLIAMHGYSGSGKTWLSQQLISRLPAIRIRSDIERKRRFGLAETGGSGAGVAAGIYRADARAGIYEVLAAAAATTLRIGQHMIVDASFLNREDRQRFRSLAQEAGADFLIVDARAERDELLRRLHVRQGQGRDASEADEDVLQYQYENAEPLDTDERQYTIAVTTDDDVDADAIATQILAARRTQ